MIRFISGLLLFALAFGLALPVRADDVETIPVPVRDLDRGEVIGPNDLTEIPTPRGAGSNVVTDAGDIVGLEARKPLRAGRAIDRSELREPVLVQKGGLVTIHVSMPGIELSTMAKAMEQGTMGDVIRVMNMASMRVVQAVVTGPGTAEVPVAPQPVF